MQQAFNDSILLIHFGDVDERGGNLIQTAASGARGERFVVHGQLLFSLLLLLL